MRKYILILSIITLITSCASKDAAPEPVKEETHTEEESTEFVSITELQMKTAGIELGTIEMKNLENSIKANGMLSVPNQNKAFVTSVNSGVVKSLLIQPGDFVQKGQTIATLVNPDVAGLQQQLQTINAQISLNEIELQRQKELVAGNAAPLKNLQRVESELITLKATRNSFQKQLSTMGISAQSVSKGNIITTLSIKAPISGTVSNVSAQIGSHIDPATPIAEIVNNSLLHLDLFVFEKDLPKVRDNQIIHFTLTSNPGKEYDAKIYSIGTAFANESKTVPVHAEVQGDKAGLIEGMNVTAVISIGEVLVTAVPTEAIITFQGQDYIFVETAAPEEQAHEESGHTEGEEESHEDQPSRYFERVQVVKGVTDVGYTEITLFNKTIPSKTAIVTKGAFFVSAKMSNAGEGAHGH